MQFIFSYFRHSLHSWLWSTRNMETVNLAPPSLLGGLNRNQNSQGSHRYLIPKCPQPNPPAPALIVILSFPLHIIMIDSFCASSQIWTIISMVFTIYLLLILVPQKMFQIFDLYQENQNWKSLPPPIQADSSSTHSHPGTFPLRTHPFPRFSRQQTLARDWGKYDIISEKYYVLWASLLCTC